MAFRQFLMLAVVSPLFPMLSTDVVASLEAAIKPVAFHSTSYVVAQSSSQSSPVPDAPPQPGQEPLWIKEINLTAEQKERIKAIQEKSSSAEEKLMPQLQAALERERSLMVGSATPEHMQQQHQQVQQLLQRLDDQHFAIVLAVREVLTPAQRVQAATLMQRHRPPCPPAPDKLLPPKFTP